MAVASVTSLVITEAGICGSQEGGNHLVFIKLTDISQGDGFVKWISKE